ncbi:putative ribosome-binding factor A, mitochondrial [Patiria miniata]|uniref:Ribosome-binding factor A, mitochondrial n=1 Tax=Patiria miniata TaxID=46514 RepID=A0A914AYD3_PATMI|nr:putative ribosome-binding factor A, mitochondrial [Patiria miniata]
MTLFAQISCSLTLSNLRRPLVCMCYYHSSSCLYKGGRRLAKLEKLLTKKKKKFYYDPMNVTQLGRLATGVTTGTNSKMRSEDSIRLRTYNKILFDNISDMMTTSYISEELEQLQLTVLGVRVSGDMSACRVYWQSTGDVKENDRIEEVLNRHKGPLRRALISHRVLGKVPPIFFLKDKASASLSEIDRLLAIADFGPEEDMEMRELDPNEIENSKTDARIEFIQKTSKGEGDASGATHQPSLFGIDHEILNKLIKQSDVGRVREGLDGDEATDKRFQQLRGFMKKKKMGKTERKEAAFYKGELEQYRSSREKECLDKFVEYETQTESDESVADNEDLSETIDNSGSEEYDEYTSYEPTKDR